MGNRSYTPQDILVQFNNTLIEKRITYLEDASRRLNFVDIEISHRIDLTNSKLDALASRHDDLRAEHDDLFSAHTALSSEFLAYKDSNDKALLVFSGRVFSLEEKSTKLITDVSTLFTSLDSHISLNTAFEASVDTKFKVVSDTLSSQSLDIQHVRSSLDSFVIDMNKFRISSEARIDYLEDSIVPTLESSISDLDSSITAHTSELALQASELSAHASQLTSLDNLLKVVDTELVSHNNRLVALGELSEVLRGSVDNLFVSTSNLATQLIDETRLRSDMDSEILSLLDGKVSRTELNSLLPSSFLFFSTYRIALESSIKVGAIVYILEDLLLYFMSTSGLVPLTLSTVPVTSSHHIRGKLEISSSSVFYTINLPGVCSLCGSVRLETSDGVLFDTVEASISGNLMTISVAYDPLFVNLYSTAQIKCLNEAEFFHLPVEMESNLVQLDAFVPELDSYAHVSRDGVYLGKYLLLKSTAGCYLDGLPIDVEFPVHARINYFKFKR